MGFLRHTNNFLLIALVSFSGFYSGLSYAKDTLTSARFIRDHETITSSNSDFKLGFFSPANSTNRYVGIWYLSESNILWIANRDQPLKDSSGVFKIHKDGNLVVLNGQNLVIWSTNVSINATNSTAQLEDSGNLVLQDDATGAIIWDSFTHPCDTFIMEKMKLSTNRITGKKIEYISWKSPSDPSTGYFTGTLELLDAPEVFLWLNKTRPYWRSGPWNGTVFIGIPEMATNDLFRWVLGHGNDGTVYLTSNLADPSAFGISSLTSYGTLKVATFHNKKDVSTIEIRQHECDIYGTCGPFGSCDALSSPICSCLIGFEPRNSQEWDSKNWTSGCIRKTPLECDQKFLKNASQAAEQDIGFEAQAWNRKNWTSKCVGKTPLQCDQMLLKNASEVVEQDGFSVLHNMKVPDFVERSDANPDKCRTDCLANCSCLAYAYDPGVGCMYWSRDLIDLQKFPNGSGVDLYIRVSHSEIDTGKDRKGDKTLIIALGATGSIALVIGAYLLWRKWTAKHTGSQPPKKIIGDQKQIKLDELPLFDFEKLAIATNNFHLANLLGKGGFGPVYKGQLEDGQKIAVKKLSEASKQGLEEFMNEVIVISKLQHRNLVRLLGCCVEGDEQMLVYEFMPNKSLDAFLFDPIQRKILDWRKRFNIIEGIARGILYLHRDSRLRIIHRDLKASNILLDEKMNPKISDFGLARIFNGDEDDKAATRKVVGTYGYMSPEYAMKGIFSEKSDVYSFGVLLLEIVSGRRSSGFYDNEQSLSLVGIAWKLWNEDNIISFIDPEIWDPCLQKSILRCIHIGLLCVQELAKERPTISTIVLMLISEITNLPPPRQVAFVQKQNLPNSHSTEKSQCNSNNNVTYSEIQGR